MIVTELIFVRHGEAQCNLDGVVGGPRTCMDSLTALVRGHERDDSQLLAHTAAPFSPTFVDRS